MMGIIIFSLTSVQETPVIKSVSHETIAPVSHETDTESFIRKEFEDIPIMIRIAYCESKFRQFGHDGSVWMGQINPLDTGAFQINQKYHLKAAQALGMDILTLEGNVAYARHLYETQGTVPWNWSKECWNPDLP